MVNRLVATSTGGVFFSRIEDTDKKREVAGGIADIIGGLRGFGVSIDEGFVSAEEEVGGYGPYQQSKRAAIYRCYVKELVRFFKYRMLDHSFPGAEIYNCTYEPAYTIEEICDAMQKATGLHRHVPLVPAGLLLFAAGILGPIGGKKVGIHPARVRKLMVSTNVCGRKLAATDYKFHYTLEESFRDWFEDCDRKELV